MHAPDSVALREYVEALLDEHIRLHTLLGEGHLRDHQLSAETMKATAQQLSETMRVTAEQLADTMKTTAETHWKNHEREHLDSNRALDKAEALRSERFAGIERLAKENKADANEWRASMTDREARFATREHLANVEKAVGELNKWRDRSEGRSTGLAPIWSVLLAIAGSVAGALILNQLLP